MASLKTFDKVERTMQTSLSFKLTYFQNIAQYKQVHSTPKQF